MSIFNKTVINRHVRRSKFNLSHSNLLTMNMGSLVPCFCKEVIPGDTFSIGASAFMRFAPMIKPIFSKINTSIHFWYVPNRLVWKNWNNFITGSKNDDGNDPVQPYLTFANGINRSSLADYIGLPANTLKFNETTGQFEEQININPNVKVSALPFRAYDLIWNNFYRDQELQEEVPISYDDGLDETTNLNLLNRAWKKDYFTSARPQAQYGDQVNIPLGDSAPVYTDTVETQGLNKMGAIFRLVNGNAVNTTVAYDVLREGGQIVGQKTTDSGIAGIMQLNNGGRLVYSKDNVPVDRFDMASNIAGEQAQAGSSVNVGGYTNEYYDGGTPGNPQVHRRLVQDVRQTLAPTNLRVDLQDASSIDIFKLRTAFQMQKFLELTSRAGNRIKEYLKAHFGVNTSDARLQLPEFLGGSTNKAIFSEILQTSESTVNSPQGNQSGHGLAYNQGIQCKKRYFEEHGWIIGLINVQPTPAYCQGIEKQFTRETRFDYGLPIFQNVGEQAILQKELYAGSQNPDSVFGYAPRYSEYKSYNNSIHGDFKGGKDIWHTARIFENDPQLNEDFVKCQPTSRIFATDSEDYQKLNVKVDFNIVAKRPFQYFSNPGINGF